MAYKGDSREFENDIRELLTEQNLLLKLLLERVEEAFETGIELEDIE